jgi:hypothetical protein
MGPIAEHIKIVHYFMENVQQQLGTYISNMLIVFGIYQLPNNDWLFSLIKRQQDTNSWNWSETSR